MTAATLEPVSAGLSPGAAHHDRLTRALHWITALLVLVIYGLALTWGFLPKGPARHLMIVAHISLGVVLTAVLATRIVWRLAPASTRQVHGGLQGLAARAVHLLLYILLVAQVALGWNWRWAQGQAVDVFGLFAIPSPFTYPPDARHTLATLHYWNGHAIIALAGLHALAALFHHVVLRDDVLRRMTVGSRS